MRKQRYEHIGKILSQDKISLTDPQTKWMQETGSYLQKATDGSDMVLAVLFVGPEPADRAMADSIRKQLNSNKYRIVELNLPSC